MQFTAFIIFFLALIAKICFAGLSIETFEPDESLVEASIEILESCYKDRLGTVGIAGPSAGSIVKGISLRKTVISTTLILETSRSVPYIPIKLGSRYKLPVFLVTVSDRNTLRKSLLQIDKSKWGNHMGSFLLIDLSGNKNECLNAFDVLRIAWEMDLLNSKFLCLNQTRGRLVYTFNPYTSQAPSTWQLDVTYEGNNGHVWTLFVRDYDEDESHCDGLEFDKATDLGGYQIRAVDEMFDWGITDINAELLMNSFNATWDVGGPGSFKMDVPIDVDWFNTSYDETNDIFLHPMPLTKFGHYPSTYPIYRDEISISTNYQGYKSQLDKLFSVLDKSSRFAVLVVLTITLLFFKFCLRQPMVPAIMNLVLVFCNAAIRGIPRQTAPRIYLASLFVLVVTIQGIYSGKLSSLLTKNVRLPTVDSLEDLARTDHAIHVLGPYSSIFNQSAFQGRDVITKETDWYSFLDSKHAFVAEKSFLIYLAEAYSSHLSRESVHCEFKIYLTRRNWPLQDKFNEVFGRLAASGIQDILYARDVRTRLRKLKSYELLDREPDVKPLTLENLAFAFKILAFGLGCATMVFIVEVATKDWD